jgi:hypothetical protein
LGTGSSSPCPAGRLLLCASINRDKDQSEYHKQNSHPGSHSFFHGVPPCPQFKEEDRIQKSEVSIKPKNQESKSKQSSQNKHSKSEDA